jgi:MFS family permease
VGIGTCLSLFGDASLYAVLPTHTAEAGVAVASMGILLSANRFVRLALNGPAGMAYDRWRRRPLFVATLFVGALSTAIYALTQGFWLLFLGRLLWGLAWSGIWVGGNTIVLDISDDDSRGRWVGAYQFAFFLGSASGSLLGGLLTDWLGYHQAMGVGASLSAAGATVALLFLPETRGLEAGVTASRRDAGRPELASHREERIEFASATALYAANRIAIAGVLMSTLGLFLQAQVEDQVRVAGRELGVATLTGIGLGLSTLTAMASAPVIGGLSDRAGNRWRVAAGGLVPGVLGFSLLVASQPWTIVLGVPLTAVTSGSNQSLSTALIGDLGNMGRQSRRLGVLFTAGDLASAVGPLLAYALIPWVGVRNVYWLATGLFSLMVLVALWRSARTRHGLAPAQEDA